MERLGRLAKINKNVLSMWITAICLDCGSNGETEVFLFADGWHVLKEVSCPSCGSKNVIVLLPRDDYFL